MARKRGEREWSATGAARAARECKASVIDFLDRSPIAVNLQAGTMDTAYRAMRRLHGTTKAAALVVQKAGLWLTEVPAPDWQVHARQVVAQEVRVLRAAPLYVMAPSMCDVTAAAAQTLTRSDLALIDVADAPTPQGFLLLPHPLPCDDGTGVLHLRGLGWSTEVAWYRDDAASDGADLKPRLRLSVYDDFRSFSDEAAAYLADRVHAEGHDVPPLLLRHVATLPFHGTVPTQAEHDQLSDALHAAAAEMAEDVLGEGAHAEYVPGAALPDPDHNVVSRLAYAFVRLADQRIAAAEQAPVNHSAKLIAQRAGMTPDVRVIQLRAKTRQGGDGHHAVDWSHRWSCRCLSEMILAWPGREARHRKLLRFSGAAMHRSACRAAGSARAIEDETREPVKPDLDLLPGRRCRTPPAQPAPEPAPPPVGSTGDISFGCGHDRRRTHPSSGAHAAWGATSA